MISIYIHIPFCKNICSYCDFSKLYKNDKWIDRYLNSLEKEIKENYRNEKVKTLYFGGGTPSCLNIDQLKKLFSITSIFELDDDCEITFECNVEDINTEKLELLSKNVNRLSIGVQTFDDKYINILGRCKVSMDRILLAKKFFDNINIDLMYGFEGQTINDLKNDIDKILELNIPHVSTYNLIIEEHTKLYINGYKNVEDERFDRYIETALKKHGYKHYEVSNYSLKGYESAHNLTYWNNLNYYGFGLGASGYIGDVRYDNTRNLDKYFNGDYRSIFHKLSLNETLQNEFILGFRKIDGISKKNFLDRYGFSVDSIDVIKDLLAKEELLENKDNIYINPKYLYVSNEILVNFLEKLC